MIQHRDK